MRSLNEHLNEGAKTKLVKRKYKDYGPIFVGERAPVRATILSFVAESENGVTKDELVQFFKSKNEELGTNTTMDWVNKNSKYFEKRSINKIDEKGNTFRTVKFKLSGLGKKLLNKLKIWEQDGK